jgi:hypothetical protein
VDMVDTDSLHDFYPHEVCLDGNEGAAHPIDQGRVHEGDTAHAYRVLDHVRS